GLYFLAVFVSEPAAPGRQHVADRSWRPSRKDREMTPPSATASPGRLQYLEASSRHQGGVRVPARPPRRQRDSELEAIDTSPDPYRLEYNGRCAELADLSS